MCRTPPIAAPTIVQGKFVAVGEMTVPRANQIATLLDDGKVLIAGGWGPPPVGAMGQLPQLRSAEIYDPAKQKFEVTGKMGSAHLSLAAVKLVNGNVLFIGGSSAEIYDVRSGRFEPAGSPINEMNASMAVALGNRRVLVCDGGTNCELYFLKAGRFRETSHTQGWSPHNPTLLPDGTVLISIVDGPGVCFELFDPETETFHTLRSGGCALWFALRLDDGRIFLGNEFFDPRDDSFLQAIGFLNTGGTATPLQSGKVLAAGGMGCISPTHSDQGGPQRGPNSIFRRTCMPSPTSQAWLYDPQTQTEVEIEDMNARRFGHSATRLRDGTVLLAGGTNGTATQSSAEIYAP